MITNRAKSPECVDLPRKSHAIYDDICDPVAFGKKKLKGNNLKQVCHDKTNPPEEFAYLGYKGALV